MTVKEVQFSKAQAPMLVIFSSITTEDKFVHPENAEAPIEVTLAGIWIELKLEHPRKALAPIVSNVSVRVIDASNRQS